MLRPHLWYNHLLRASSSEYSHCRVCAANYTYVLYVILLQVELMQQNPSLTVPYTRHTPSLPRTDPRPPQ